MSKMFLKNIPKLPGVYQFFDKKGNIIYIGKSVNLFSRVNSYFNGKAKLNFAKQKMIKQIADIKTIITSSETESLMLESNLIKKYKPKYNILLKDDKNHLYIKITDEPWPKIIKTRFKAEQIQNKFFRKNKGHPQEVPLQKKCRDTPCGYPIKNSQEKLIKGATYFGPYLSSANVENILKIIKKVFGYGVGEHNFFMGKGGYNLDKYLFGGKISPYPNLSPQGRKELEKKLYLEKIEKIKLFLKKDYKKIILDLEKQMKDFASSLEFEKAAKLKEQISALKSLDEYQVAKGQIPGNYDIINFLEKYDKQYIGLIKLRDSKIVGYYSYIVENKLEETKQEILKNFVENLYTQASDKNIKYILPFKPKNTIDDINKKIEVPQKGAKLDLLKMAYKNIYEFAYKKHIASLSTKGFSKQTMKNILEMLGFERINKDITFECNDISHLSGTHTVASRSVIINGKTANSKYKKFNIKTLEQQKIDDFNSMREIAKRRILELEKHGNYPDLIIIDGGKGQLSSVYEIFNNSKLEKNKIQLIGIAKKEEILYKFENNNFKEFKLDKSSQELKLIQKLRDEAHRFAIGFNRDKRIKSMKTNILESIPGIGPKTRKKLLNKFGSLENIKKEELKGLISKSQIEALEDHGII